MADYDAALAVDPTCLTALRNRGNLRGEDLKDHAGALEDHTRLVELAPDEASHHVALGCTLRDMGDATRALAAFEAALARDPDEVVALANRATLLAAKDPAAARRDLDRALRLAPRNEVLLCQRGELRLGQGDVAGAIEDLSRATEVAPRSGRAWANLGAARSRAGDVEGARDAWTRGRAVAAPGSAEARWLEQRLGGLPAR